MDLPSDLRVGGGTIDDEERRHRCWLEQIEDDALIWHDKRHHVFFSLLRLRRAPGHRCNAPTINTAFWSVGDRIQEQEEVCCSGLYSRDSLQLRFFYLFFFLHRNLFAP